MATLADRFRADLLDLAGLSNAKDLYEWGEVFRDIAQDGSLHPDANTKDTDCSGLGVGEFRWLGFHIPRYIADDFKNLGKAISRPSRVGDAGFGLRSDGTAHHVIWYVDGAAVGQEDVTVEARGEAYGIEKHSIAYDNQRGIVWRRMPWDLGKLTPPTPMSYVRVGRASRQVLLAALHGVNEDRAKAKKPTIPADKCRWANAGTWAGMKVQLLIVGPYGKSNPATIANQFRAQLPGWAPGKVQIIAA